MKTVIVYEQMDESTKFILVDGDLSDLDGVYGNATDSTQEDQDRLYSHLFNEDWEYKVEMLDKFPKDLGTLGTDFIVISCGFY